MTGALVSWVLSREITAWRESVGIVRGAEVLWPHRRQHCVSRFGEDHVDPARSETSCARGNTLHGNREIPGYFCAVRRRERREASRRTPTSYVSGKSDCCVVPKKLPNKAWAAMLGRRRWWREGGRPREVGWWAPCAGLRAGFHTIVFSGQREVPLLAGAIAITQGRSRMR